MEGQSALLRQKAVVAVLCLQILFFAICSTVILRKLSTQTACCVDEKSERYRSVRIYSGESLWEISSRYYSDDYHSMELYIERIMRLNHLTDGTIMAGEYLLIPYYEE